MDKKQLAILLSKLSIIKDLNIELEQYQTEGDLAADVLWKALLNENIENKRIADFGCGNGIFGIGALLLGAKKVYFIELDKNSIKTAKENYKKLKLKNGVFVNKNIKYFDKNIDTVLMNPPFGVQNEHADKLFLEKAIKISNNIYSLHKIESKNFIEKLSMNKNFKVKSVTKYEFRLKQTYEFHKKRMYNVSIGLWHLQKNNNN